MRKTIVLAALAASVAFATAAQASDHSGRSDGRAIERSEHDGYRRDDERREHRERASRSHHERREVRESRRRVDRDDAR